MIRLESWPCCTFVGWRNGVRENRAGAAVMFGVADDLGASCAEVVGASGADDAAAADAVSARAVARSLCQSAQQR